MVVHELGRQDVVKRECDRVQSMADVSYPGKFPDFVKTVQRNSKPPRDTVQHSWRQEVWLAQDLSCKSGQGEDSVRVDPDIDPTPWLHEIRNAAEAALCF